MRAFWSQRALPLALVAGFLLCWLLPRYGVLNQYVELILKYIGIGIILTVSLNLVNGYMGEFSVGHAGFMAVGAYVASVLTVKAFPAALGPWLFPAAVLLGGAAAGVMGLLLAFPSFRTRGDYLAIVTLAFNMIIKSVLENLPWLGGPMGFMGMQKLATLPGVFGWVVLTLWLTRNFLGSRVGRGVLALREDETAAELVGVNTRQVKVITFVLSAVLAGVAGALFAHVVQFINPKSFTLLKSTEMLVMVYLGGVASLGGSILGATVFTVVLEGLRPLLALVHLSPEWRMVAAPLLLVLLMLFRPNGIMGHREFSWLRPPEPGRRRRPPQQSATSVSALWRPRPDAATGELLHLDGLSHHFQGLRAVSDFSLDLRTGEVVALIGPNGAGKTTLFNLITGVYRPTAGRIGWQGRDLTGRPSHYVVQAGIARTFQNIRLFRRLSVLDNVRIAQYGHSPYGVLSALLGTRRVLLAEYRVAQRARQLLAVFGLLEYAEQPAQSLPYGLQRRLEIARALATRPQLLLLDEPAAGMNPAEVQSLMHLLQHLHQTTGVTILLIEHQMPVVMGLAQRIKVLDFGETIAEGTPQEIRHHPRVIAAYLGAEGQA